MSFESLKYPRSREALTPNLEDIELLHSSIQFILPPQVLLNSNPDKKFHLRTRKPGNWPKIVILSQNEEMNREIYISLNGLPQENTYFSYLLSPNEDILPPSGEFTNFLEEDYRVYADKCSNVKNSLLKADSVGVIDGWDALPS